MRDYAKELADRVLFVKNILKESGATGIVFGNSGGKDSVLVGIICKKACDRTLGIMMPCSSVRNYSEDISDAKLVSEQFEIESRLIDLGPSLAAAKKAVSEAGELSDMAASNIAPRLRMTALYAVAQSEGRLVAATSNRSELFMGYFTKWGDGAGDFNPIADLTVTEIYEFLEYLKVPKELISKPPSGGLFEGQTDESEMGVTYAEIDNYLLHNIAPAPAKMEIINRFNQRTEHKRTAIKTFR